MTSAASHTVMAAQVAPSRASEANVAIELRGVAKRFPSRRGWKESLRHPLARSYTQSIGGVSLKIATGEFFGLLGPNGAGKTTLFKMLATLVLPDEGTATVAGYDVVRDAEHVRRVLAPVIADERSLFWRLSAEENLRLFATLQGLAKSAIPGRVEELLHAVELSDVGRKLVGAFSSGMKQRLLIARALVSRPKILLLDEPTRSLDPLSARSFRSFLRDEISLRQGCTVLLATHNAEEALELCHRVGVLDRGRLLAVGAADELSRRFVPDRYRIWTRHPQHAAFTELARGHALRNLTPVRDDEALDSWPCLQMEISGGHDQAARVVDALARAGVSIARFERVPVSLASLLDAIMARPDADVGDA